MDCFQLVPADSSFRSLRDLLTSTVVNLTPEGPKEDKEIQKLRSIFLLEAPCLRPGHAIKDRLKAIVAEKYFIEVVGNAFETVLSCFEMVDRLKAVGCKFLYDGHQRSTLVLYPEKLPWQLFRIAYRISQYSHFSKTQGFEKNEQIFRELVVKIIESEAQFPESHDSIMLMLQSLDYIYQQSLFKSDLYFSIIHHGDKYVQAHQDNFNFSQATFEILQNWQFCREKIVRLTKDARRLCAGSPENTELRCRLAIMDNEYQKEVSRLGLDAVKVYKSQFSETVKEYSKLYQEMVAFTQKKKQGSSHLGHLFSPTERLVWGSLIVLPEKFAEDRPPVNFEGRIDRIRSELIRKKTACSSQSEKPPAIPLEGRAFSGGSKKTKSRQSGLKEKEVTAVSGSHVVDDKPGSSAPVGDVKAGQLAAMFAVVQSEKSADDKQRSAVAVEDKKAAAPAAAPAVTIGAAAAPKAASSDQSTESNLPKVGDQLRSDFFYGIHVARWHLLGDFDPFTHDPVYMGEDSESRRAGIRLHHTLPLALHTILIRFGTAFEKRGTGGKLVRTTFALVGEIEFPDGVIQKGIYTLGVGSDRIIFHSHFTRLSVSEILQKMGADGSLKVDDVPEICTRVVSQKVRQSYQLPHDESQVCYSSIDCISVMNAKGIIFRALPFHE